MEDSEVHYKASRSGGPGGQHVNTTSSRVELTWNVKESEGLSEAQRARLLSRLKRRIDRRGVLRIVVSSERSRHRNQKEALERLRKLVTAVLKRRRVRRPTKPTKASQRRRLDAKRRRGAVKRERRRRPDEG